MPSLHDDFLELMERVRQGRDLSHSSYEPIYYLVFHPSEILAVKRQIPAWIARLTNDGWIVSQFSITQTILGILAQAPLRDLWIKADGKDPTNWSRTNSSIANLINGGPLLSAFERTLESLKDKRNAILLVTDLEALHPYLRIGSIESQLMGKFTAPTIFFYPGERTGKIGLKFLGFYPEDGNYRSVHVGG